MVTRARALAVMVVGLLTAVSCDHWPGVGDSDGGPPAAGSQLEDTTGLLGSSCGSTVSCRGDLTCVTTAPGGLCTKACQSDADCDLVGSCQYVQNWGGQICLKSCSSDQSCRPQYSCQATTTGNVCFQAPVLPGDGG